MQVKSLNFVVDTGRKRLVKRYNPDEYDLVLNTLKAQHLELNDYFSHVIDDDMADMLEQSEILEPDAKKRRNSAKRKQSKD